MKRRISRLDSAISGFRTGEPAYAGIGGGGGSAVMPGDVPGEQDPDDRHRGKVTAGGAETVKEAAEQREGDDPRFSPRGGIAGEDRRADLVSGDHREQEDERGPGPLGYFEIAAERGRPLER